MDHVGVQHGNGGEGLVRRIAQGAGQGAALGLVGAQVQPRLLQLAAEGGRQAQEVAGAVQAVGVDARGLGAPTRDVGVARQRPAAVFLGEALHQLDVGREAVDVDRQGLGAGRLAAGRVDDGPADQTDDVGADFGGVEAARQQRPVGPVDPHVAGVQPNAVAVGDRDPLQREVVEQVALQPIDVDAAVAADLLALDKAGDQLAAGVRDDVEASAEQGGRDQQGQPAEHAADDEADRL